MEHHKKPEKKDKKPTDAEVTPVIKTKRWYNDFKMSHVLGDSNTKIL